MGKKKTKTKTTTALPKGVRSPIVTIMGHVDHGKTSLLDYIRQAHVQAKEAGGITQHIGAYQINHQESKITFIDTPGHAAFNKMRSRGAKVTDIIILVVAATEGVKPQTIESISHIKSAGVPFIIAINKMDLPTADPMLVKSELAKYEVMVEEFQGDVPVVEVSAKTGKGVDQLLEMIQLVYEMGPVKAAEEDELDAVIIESSLHKQKGPIATALIRAGSLKVGDDVYIEQEKFRIRSLSNDQGVLIKKAGPADPVEVMGIGFVPPVGAKITTTQQEAALIVEEEKAPSVDTDEVSQYQEDLRALLEEKEMKRPPTINIILKADVQGSLEAIMVNLPEEVVILESSAGEVSDSDIMLAATTKSTIIAFNTKIQKSSKKLAEDDGVEIKQYKLIYKLLEDMEKIILKILEPTIDEEELGVADIKQVFEMKGDRIAGCKVISGRIQKGDLIHLMREDKIHSEVIIRSLKQAKEDVEKVKSSNECGIVLKPQHTFKEGDQLVAYKKKEE